MALVFVYRSFYSMRIPDSRLRPVQRDYAEPRQLQVLRDR